MLLFSVIIPNYNHGNFLLERINSVLSQTYQYYEVIILDDASSDESRNIIGKFRNHKKVTNIVFNEYNSGSPFKQWKKGIELAKGDWIWIAESDDIASEYFLEEMHLVITKNLTTSIIYSDSFLIDEKGNPYNKASIIKNKFFDVEKWDKDYCNPGIVELNENLKYLCTINNTSSMVIKRSVCLNTINEISVFNYYGDWFFFIKASLESSIFYLNKPLCFYRNHSGNHVNNHTSIIKTKKEYFSILEFLLHHPLISDKNKLIDFFVLHYLGFGLIREGMIEGARVFKQYFAMDKKLTIKVLLKFLSNKLTSRKNNKEYI